MGFASVFMEKVSASSGLPPILSPAYTQNTVNSPIPDQLFNARPKRSDKPARRAKSLSSPSRVGADEPREIPSEEKLEALLSLIDTVKAREAAKAPKEEPKPAGLGLIPGGNPTLEFSGPTALPDISIRMPAEPPSALGRMATFGGAGALLNAFLGSKDKSVKDRALKGAILGLGLGGVYHLLKK